jgi:hypothetical protein
MGSSQGKQDENVDKGKKAEEVEFELSRVR